MADELLVIGYNEAKALIIPAAAADALLGLPLLPAELLLLPADEFGGTAGPPGGPYRPDMAPGPNRPKAAALCGDIRWPRGPRDVIRNFSSSAS